MFSKYRISSLFIATHLMFPPSSIFFYSHTICSHWSYYSYSVPYAQSYPPSRNYHQTTTTNVATPNKKKANQNQPKI